MDPAAPGGPACPLPSIDVTDQVTDITEPSIDVARADGVHALRGYSGAQPRGHSEASAGSGVSSGSGVSEPEPAFTTIVGPTPVPIPPAGATDMPAHTRGPEESDTALGEAAAPRGSGASGAPGDTGSARSSDGWSSDPPPFRD